MQYVFPTSVFLAPRSLMGLGAGFWWLGLLLTFTCSWKEPSALLPLSRSGPRQTQTVQRSGGSEGHRCGAHVARQNMKEKKKQGTCAVCRLLQSLAGVAFVFFAILCFGKQNSFPGKLMLHTHLYTCSKRGWSKQNHAHNRAFLVDLLFNH